MTLSPDMHRNHCFFLGIFLFLTGCAGYHYRQVAHEAANTNLIPPPMREIRIQAENIRHPVLRPIAFDERDGLSSDEAAVLAVLVNPSLRVERDRLALAEAQVPQPLAIAIISGLMVQMPLVLIVLPLLLTVLVHRKLTVYSED